MTTHSHTSQPPLHVDCVFGVANFGRGVNTQHFVANMHTLSHCDVICISEPGTSYRNGTQNNLAVDPFHVIHAMRPQDDSYAGVLLLVRKSKLSVAFADAHCAPGIQMSSCTLLRAQATGPSVPVCVVVAVYATCSESFTLSAREFTLELSRRVDAIRQNASPGTPVVIMGDFNAHHPSFGDESEPNARGNALHTWAHENALQAVGLPTRGSSALDILLCSNHLPVCEPAVRKVLGTDHTHALTVDIDPNPSADTVYFEHRAFAPDDIDEAHFLSVLDRQLAQQSGTRLRERDFHLLRALRAAMSAVGFVFRRVPVRSRTIPPTIQQVVHAAHRSVWSALRLLRPRSPRLQCDVPLDEILACFGSAGKQKHHTDAPLVRAPPATFTPVCREEVAAAVRRHNPRACADSDGLDSFVLRLAAKSTLFLDFFADTLSECLRQGAVPSRWNTCDITPIPKPGRDSSVIANLRPIYLINMIAKTADRVLDTRCRAAFTPHPHQFGYRQGVPIDVAPLAALEMCVRGQHRNNGCISGREPVACLLIAADISDGFPGAAARGIIDGYGQLPEDLRQVKIAQLTRRRIRVKHRGSTSRWDQIRDGTNQGYVSGPVDFSAFSSTLLDRLVPWSQRAGASKHFSMVADDLSATIVGKKADIRAAADAFFKILGDWLAEYEMRLSPKTKAVVVTPTQATTSSGNWAMSFRCQHVTIKTSFKSSHDSAALLGYRVDLKLCLGDAVRHAIAKHDQALHAMAPLTCATTMRDRTAVYDSLVLSHIRRICVVVMAVHGHTSSHWEVLNRAVADGARVITGAIVTANNTLVALEAGFPDARAIAVREAVRLTAKFHGNNIHPP